MANNKLVAERERAHLARQVTDNPLWDESWQLYLDGIWNSWMHTAPDDYDARERAYMAFHVAKEVRAHFTTILTTGKLAEIALEEDRERDTAKH